jgi:hypothetical protein
MGFSTEQLRALQRNLHSRYVRTRSDNGRELSYIEGWHAIAEANRIFGFDGWNRETVESRCVMAREIRGSFSAVYVAKIRITVRAGGETIIREGHGTGQGRGATAGDAHDMAYKAAETDATKRALATFGKPFGLALYLGSNRTDRPTGHYSADQITTGPLPSRGSTQARAHPQNLHHRTVAQSYPDPQSMDESPPQEAHSGKAEVAPERPAAPATDASSTDANPPKIDKGALTLSEPRRFRDKFHLAFVCSQPCLLCGRQPSDPHHLRFAQPRALGRKVSDEFTVPLCRVHHRQVHQTGDEARWWEDMDVDPVIVAHGLWEESRAKRGLRQADTPSSQRAQNRTAVKP